ncbi:hypothetical protein FISHEDRAFT_58688 [Fistulina hepatica ATCC 64428]|uniref:C3H1-type domain-containing protein n=1 Tax=Fistulina hepatica ATCC 64428 TaxID=1128425 RepID=A0A0D7AD23_9AGAR|nr:hypothetical protein FISHEDRAFT_58688 [Fistulina hepatica ATCC 64428]
MADAVDDDDRHEKKKTKAKDLSHVPCKFFKVGGCTAGSSCPFSHNLPEPGGQKDVCAWFVKGNCKFGHKCALAHVLPGQSMSMDRKNKKAAQAQAQANREAAGGGGGNNGKRRERRVDEGKRGDDSRRDRGDHDDHNGSARKERNVEGMRRDRSGDGSRRDKAKDGGLLGGPGGLLSGSTAPTRVLTSSRPPMALPLKASISPSAPAPALRDIDFTVDGVDDAPPPAKSYSGVLKDSHPARNATASAPIPRPPLVEENDEPEPWDKAKGERVDFGPIGSPTKSTGISPTSPRRANGISINSPDAGSSHDNSPHKVGSPGSHANSFMSTSPFTAPAGRYYEQGTTASYYERSNSSAFLGDMGLSRSVGWGGMGLTGRREEAESTNSDKLGQTKEEDLEDFIPSSLSELLTPEETSRRMNRRLSNTSGVPAPMSKLTSTDPTTGAKAAVEESGGAEPKPGLAPVRQSSPPEQPYSRSVPAPSLLGIKSIWGDANADKRLPSQSRTPAMTVGSPSQYGEYGLAGRNGAYGNVVNLHTGSPSNAHLAVGSPTSNTFRDAIGSLGSVGETFTAHYRLGMSLSPSNASAAFLPNIHREYHASLLTRANAGADQSRLNRNITPPVPSQAVPSLAMNSSQSQPLGAGTSTLTPSDSTQTLHGNSTSTGFTKATSVRSPFDLTQYANGQPLLGTNTDPYGGNTIMSPSSKALHSHAPGQSLPQGLAAGYSRIHALPPLNSPANSSAIGSPGLNSAFNVGSFTGSSFGARMDYSATKADYGSFSAKGLSDWAASTPPSENTAFGLSGQNNGGLGSLGSPPGLGIQHPKGLTGNPSLDAMFSRLSVGTPTGGAQTVSQGPRWANSHLRRPSQPTMLQGTDATAPYGTTVGQNTIPAQPGFAHANDDDDLFSMDG